MHALKNQNDPNTGHFFSVRAELNIRVQPDPVQYVPAKHMRHAAAPVNKPEVKSETQKENANDAS